MIEALVNDLKQNQRLVLEVFIELCEGEPKFFKNDFQILFSYVYQIYKEWSGIDFAIKKELFEMVICIIERFGESIINQ